jgi:hypothetical protein
MLLWFGLGLPLGIEVEEQSSVINVDCWIHKCGVGSLENDFSLVEYLFEGALIQLVYAFVQLVLLSH